MSHNKEESNTNGHAGNEHISVYLIDDHPAIRDAICGRIAGVSDMEICGETGSSEVAIRQIETLGPEVAVVDISLQDGHGFDLLESLRVQCPAVQPVVFSMFDERVYVERALRAGAAGYLMKKEPTSALVEAIRTASEGEVYLSKKMFSHVMNKVSGRSDGLSFPIDELTDRELSVFQMLGQGHRLKEIEERLGLARKTVETYRRRAKEKLGLDTVSDLLQFAVKWTYDQGQEEGETAGP